MRQKWCLLWWLFGNDQFVSLALRSSMIIMLRITIISIIITMAISNFWCDCRWRRLQSLKMRQSEMQTKSGIQKRTNWQIPSQSSPFHKLISLAHSCSLPIWAIFGWFFCAMFFLHHVSSPLMKCCFLLFRPKSHVPPNHRCFHFRCIVFITSKCCNPFEPWFALSSSPVWKILKYAASSHLFILVSWTWEEDGPQAVLIVGKRRENAWGWEALQRPFGRFASNLSYSCAY